MHLYRDIDETSEIYLAHTMDEAFDLACNPDVRLERVADDEPITIDMSEDPDKPDRVTRSAAEWIAVDGREGKAWQVCTAYR